MCRSWGPDWQIGTGSGAAGGRGGDIGSHNISNQTTTHEYGDNYNGNISGSNVGGRGNQNTVNGNRQGDNLSTLHE